MHKSKSRHTLSLVQSPHLGNERKICMLLFVYVCRRTNINKYGFCEEWENKNIWVRKGKVAFPTTKGIHWMMLDGISFVSFSHSFMSWLPSKKLEFQIMAMLIFQSQQRYWCSPRLSPTKCIGNISQVYVSVYSRMSLTECVCMCPTRCFLVTALKDVHMQNQIYSITK